MIYYSNSNLTTPHLTFIGRWTPFHKGHIAIIETKRAEHPKAPILVMVRNTKEDAYSPSVRAEYIKIWMQKKNIKGTVMIVPNVEGVYWGRGVGYNVGLVDVDISVQKISGTRIRNQISKKSPGWKHAVADKHASYLLSPAVSRIVDGGLVVWLTGCPSSGKTTIARALSDTLHDRFPHIKTQILDGDDMRTSPLAAGVGFSKEDRANHIRRMAYLAGMFASHGVIVICAFVSPDAAIRNEAKRHIGQKRFVEVYVHANKKLRMMRDNKGLYRKAKLGKIDNLTGFNAPYQKSPRPDVTCDTGKLTLTSCVNRILVHIMSR
ncbi:adenylyl-sulfate kinase [Patescibacteria group bacterium]|nr:adenylyl-sulfate kinase [Patescibacteria group bacterium]